MDNMKTDLIVIGSSAMIQTICGITQTNEVFQRIQIIVAIISGVMAGIYYASKFLIKFVKWFKKAKKDGKITIDESKCNNCARCVKSCPTEAWKGEPGYIVSFGGTFGNKIYKGEENLPIIKDKETLFRVADAAIGFFEEYANAGERFRATLQRVGEDEFRNRIQAAYEGN